MTAPGPPKLGRYELITRIGEGGMAEVQLALQRGPAGFEKLVVVKLVHENLASQKPFVDMLLDEARVAALVKHPNVVDIYDLGEADGRYFIAMEYLEGEPLLAVLRAGRDGQRLDVLSTARLIADTAEGLDAAHELRSLAGEPIELVHHDVSLGNIVVLYNGQVKLVDFGVAKATQSASTRNKVQGKFSYMAPEKLRGGTGDRRSDIWSLGCVLWEALTLRRLFKAGNDRETMQLVLEGPIAAPSTINGEVPAAFDAIVLRALEREPDQRYVTAKAMAEDLERVLHGHGYAAKNDQIARYMQSTFHAHIAARKKLLQEVSSKGRASPDVLEAAFDARDIASGTPALQSGESWTKRALSSAEMAPLARPVEPELAPTVIDAPVLAGALPEPVAAAVTVPDVEAVAVPARKVPRIAIATGVAAVLAVVVGAIALTRTSAPEVAMTSPPVVAPHVAEQVEPVAKPVVEPEPVVQPVEQPAMKPEPVQPVLARTERLKAAFDDDRPVRRKRVADKPAEKPAVDKAVAEDTFKQGFQAYVHGDAKTALASYKKALQADASYAPAWRGIGLVYEKLGDKPAARAAFQRYLKLAPAASDAASIKARLDPS